jgi:hypothetical protein
MKETFKNIKNDSNMVSDTLKAKRDLNKHVYYYYSNMFNKFSPKARFLRTFYVPFTPKKQRTLTQ